MKAIIFHNKEEINYFQKFKNLKEMSIYAWTPEAVDELNRHGLAYKLPGDLHIAEFNLKKRNKFIKKYKKIIDFFDHEFVKKTKKNHFTPFQNFSLGVRNIVAAYYLEADIIFLILKKKYKELYYFNYRGQKTLVSEIFKKVEKNKTNLKAISPCWGLSTKVPEIHCSSQFSNNYKNNFYKKILKQISRIKNLKKVNADIFNNSSNFSKSSKSVLILDSDFKDLENTIAYLKKKNYNICFWHSFANNNKVNIEHSFSFEKLKKSKRLNDLLTVRNMSFLDEIIAKFKDVLNGKINLLYSNLLFFIDLNSRFNFEFILTSFDDPLAQAISSYLEQKKLKTKILIFQHGGTLGLSSLQPFQNEYTKKNGANSYFVVYTKTIEKFQKNIAKNLNTKTKFLTGDSHYFKNILSKGTKKKINNSKVYTICIVVGQFVKACENNFGIYRESNMYDTIKKITEILYDIKHINLVIKCGYNIEKRKLDLFKKYTNIKVVNTRNKLMDYIDKINLFILPSISTTFLELSCSSKNMIVYNDLRAHSLKKSTITLMKTRSFYSSQFEEFIDLIKSLKNELECKKLV